MSPAIEKLQISTDADKQTLVQKETLIFHVQAVIFYHNVQHEILPTPFLLQNHTHKMPHLQIAWLQLVHLF